MNKLAALLILGSLGLANAQTSVERSIQVSAGNILQLTFDYPELRLRTWEKPEVLIKGTVSINRGENDQAFELITRTEGNVVQVTSLLKDKEKIPKRILIHNGDQDYYFKTENYNDPMVQRFLEEHGHDYGYMSQGIIKEIQLEVFVPAGMETRVEAKYGMVEVIGFQAPIHVDAKYGGVDATIGQSDGGEIVAKTRYGEILTNLEANFQPSGTDKKTGFPRWTEVHARVGSGHSYTLESAYGKVYLRKPGK